jgi:PDZ domain-containing protein
MRRRGVTVLVGAILLMILAWQTTIITVPYVWMAPGPTYDTIGKVDGKPVIAVTGAPTSTSAGQLRMVTIEVQPDLTLFDAMYGWIADDKAVVPRELIYPPNQTQQQVDDENAAAFKESQSSAETTALRYLGYPVHVTVAQIAAGYDAGQVLKTGDSIDEVDGTPVTSLQKLTELVRAKPADTARTVTYTHDGVKATGTITTKKGEDGNPRLGVTVEEKQPHPFDLKIGLEKVGGPSAGLMFTLGIIDTLKPEDLTGGKIIAGTGTIDEEGNVGPIGGIPQKLVAAKAAKAKFFLTPADNCAEALANAVSGLPLIKVSTLDEALKALETIRAGQTPPVCSR